MAKTITIMVKLTLAEARALSHAAGNTTSDPYAMEAVFRTRTEINSAYRAHQKLDDALRGGSLMERLRHPGRDGR